MWDDYEGMSWPERLVNGGALIVNAGAVILGGAMSFLFFCLSNLRVIAGAILASLCLSICWTSTHPKLPAPSAPSPVVTPALTAPIANVLYPKTYNGPDMYGVQQNK